MYTPPPCLAVRSRTTNLRPLGFSTKAPGGMSTEMTVPFALLISTDMPVVTGSMIAVDVGTMRAPTRRKSRPGTIRIWPLQKQQFPSSGCGISCPRAGCATADASSKVTVVAAMTAHRLPMSPLLFPTTDLSDCSPHRQALCGALEAPWTPDERAGSIGLGCAPAVRRSRPALRPGSSRG